MDPHHQVVAMARLLAVLVIGTLLIPERYDPAIQLKIWLGRKQRVAPAIRGTNPETKEP